MLVGGGPTTAAMVQDFKNLCGGTIPEVVILPQSEPNPEDGKAIVALLQKNGFTDLYMSRTSIFTESEKSELELRLSNAVAVWVPDGDPALFVKRLGLAWCQRVFPKLIEKGVNWFGCGGGAELVGNPMFDRAKTVEGIGLIDAVVDTHYYTRHHEMRLRKAFFSCRVQYGLGLDEGEWVIIRDNLIEKKVGVPQVFLRE